MREKPYFSIVVPACGVELYAEKMIESVKTQTCPDFEALICCEPGADETEKILRRAIGDDPRFFVSIHPLSGSASVSRNYGIEHAKGRYLVFLDGDDWLEPDALEQFLKAAETFREPDMITCEYRLWRDGVQLGNVKTHSNHGRVVSGIVALTEFFRDKSFRTATWGSIYRRDFLLSTGLLQTPGRRHQDDEWTPRVFCAAERVLISDIVSYDYRRRDNSVTTDRNSSTVNDVAANLGTLLDFIEKEHLPEELFRFLGRWQCLTAISFCSEKWRGKYPRVLRCQALSDAMKSDSRRRTLRRLRGALKLREKIFLATLCLSLRCGSLWIPDRIHAWLFRSF